ncbi:hypothetical protein PSP6_60209 [Paraburkholderia tropica]|nr:hypothetical protein PSP6_60209 [Paraburkholderia tropica]
MTLLDNLKLIVKMESDSKDFYGKNLCNQW